MVFFDRTTDRIAAALVTGLSCVAYGIDQSIYTGAQLSVLFGGPAAATAEGFGRANLMASAALLYFDLALMCGLCLGMVLLLVEEHRRAEQALAGRTERAIRISDQRFAAVFRSNPCAMAIMSMEDDRFLDVNGTFERTSGFTRAELLGRTTLELGMWIDETERTALLARLMVDGRFHAAEVRFRQKSGKTAVVVFSAEIIELAGERCVVLAGLDVTALQEVEARHKAILEALPDWVFLTTSDGTFLEFHARDQRHLVMPPAEFLHRNVMDVLPHELAVRVMNCFSQALRSRQPATLEYSLDIGSERRFYEFERCRRSQPGAQPRAGRHRPDARGAARPRPSGRAGRHRARDGARRADRVSRSRDQPALSAINNNAHAALLLLESAPFDAVALRETIADIVSDNLRIDDIAAAAGNAAEGAARLRAGGPQLNRDGRARASAQQFHRTAHRRGDRVGATAAVRPWRPRAAAAGGPEHPHECGGRRHRDARRRWPDADRHHGCGRPDGESPWPTRESASRTKASPECSIHFHDQAQRHGSRTVDLPHDHGRTWRTHRGRASGPGRHLLVLARSRAPQGNKGACRTTSLDSGRGERQGVRRMIAPLPTRMAGTVFVVDDDLSVRRSLERLVKSAGWAVRTLPRLRSYCAKTCLRLIAPVSSPMCTWGT